MNEHQFTAAIRAKFNYDPIGGVLSRAAKCGKWKAGQRVGSTDSKGHRQVRFEGTLYLEHRLIWLHVFGRWPDGEIDHINRNRSDNRLSNLRECVHAENMKNQSIRSTNKTGVSGVSFYKPYGKYAAHIRFAGRQQFLGYFAKFEDAVFARRSAENKYYGEFSPNHSDPEARAA